MGWKDRLDVLRWMDIANDIYGGNTQMVVHGISMGAATTMMVSGEPQQPFVKCFVEDCGYTSVWDEFLLRVERAVRAASFPVDVHYQLAVQREIRLELQGSFFAESGQEMQTADVLHSWRCRYIRAHLDGISPLRGKNQNPKNCGLPPVPHTPCPTSDHPEEYTERVKNFVGKYIY